MTRYHSQSKKTSFMDQDEYVELYYYSKLDISNNEKEFLEEAWKFYEKNNYE